MSIDKTLKMYLKNHGGVELEWKRGQCVFRIQGEQDREAVAERRQVRYEARQQSDSESDVSVSSIATDDLSDSTLRKRESMETRWKSSWKSSCIWCSQKSSLSMSCSNKLLHGNVSLLNQTQNGSKQLTEMKAFVGLHVLFGIRQLPATHPYWSTDPLIGVTAVQKVM